MGGREPTDSVGIHSSEGCAPHRNASDILERRGKRLLSKAPPPPLPSKPAPHPCPPELRKKEKKFLKALPNVGAGSPAGAKAYGDLGPSPTKVSDLPYPSIQHPVFKAAPTAETLVTWNKTAASGRLVEGHVVPSGAETYVKNDFLPDPINLSTKEWWKQVEDGASGLKKKVKEYAIWWRNRARNTGDPKKFS